MKKGRKPLDSEITERSFYARNSIASANECTGLTPVAVADDDEAIEYANLYGIYPPLPPDK